VAGRCYEEIVGTVLALPGSVDYEKMTGLAVCVASIAAAQRLVVRQTALVVARAVVDS
jgi:hypothetical protein